MTAPTPYRIVSAPRTGTNDDVVRVLKWLVEEGQRVEPSTLILIVETTKASVEVEAESAGYVFRLVEPDAEVPVGAPIAVVSDTPSRPAVGDGVKAVPSRSGPVGDGLKAVQSRSGPQQPAAGTQLVTKSARALIEQHGLSLEPFAALSVVRASDVEDYLATQAVAAASSPARAPSPEDEAKWDAMLASPIYRDMQEMLALLRARMQGKFNRHVPIGTLLGDRWRLAKDHGFGEGTSVYDECLIKGTVRVGNHCWIGPYTILDGQHAPLVIGDWVDIGSGTQLYTHDSIERALTGGRAPLATGPITIGNYCFIAPMVSIGPGTTIGEHSFVAAGSYVQGPFKPYSYIAGNPARRVGTVEIDGDRARIRRG
jgi:acetyltransferase-like isoleucine patch superfamily enzyme